MIRAWLAGIVLLGACSTTVSPSPDARVPADEALVMDRTVAPGDAAVLDLTTADLPGTDDATPNDDRGTLPDGSCRAACAPGLADCDGLRGNGREVDLSVDVDHCGACGRVCVVPHATPACTAGECAIGRCDEGVNGQLKLTHLGHEKVTHPWGC